MAKDTYYFTHDYNCRTDEKIRHLLFRHGMRGYGVFWAIVEDLYNNANVMRLDCERIAHELHEDISVVNSVINDFDLFVFEGDNFGSLSVQRRLNEREQKSAKARKSAFDRWNKSDRNANAMRTHTERNAKKEIKEKEKKENNIDVPSELSGVWKDFLAMRKTIRKPATERAQKIILKKLKQLSENKINIAIEILNQSIVNSWQDIYPLKKKNESGQSTIEADIATAKRVIEQLG